MEKGYYHTKESVEEYIKLAKGHSGEELILKLQEYLPAGATLLELGSGPGVDWKILASDYQITGSDNSIEFIDHLAANNPKSTFLELDAVTIQTDQAYDGIYSNKVLHHLTDQELRDSIKRQHEVLNTGGIICHSFWKGKGSETFKGLFVNSHLKPDIENFFTPYFEILVLEEYQEFDKDDSILVIGRKR